MSATERDWSRGARYWAAAIVVGAFAVRLVVNLSRDWVGYDEANYLMIARNAASGAGYVQSVLAVYASKFHCLPFLMPQVLGPLFGDYLLSSKFLYLVLGPVTVGLAIALGGRLFGARVGLVSGALCAVAPVLTSLLASSLTHSLFVPAYTGALWLAWTATEEERPGLALAAGAAVGLGWWSRADGLLVVPMMTLFLALAGVILSNVRRTVLNVLAFLGAFGVLYVLYAAFVARISGGATAPHGPLFDFLLYVPECGASRDLASYESFVQLALHEPQCVLRAMIENAKAAPSVLLAWTGFPMLLLPLVGAGWVAERYDRRTIAAHLLVLFGILPLTLYLPFYFKETRYVAPYAVLCFVWCALGLETIRARVSGVLGRVGGWIPAVLLVGFLLCITALHVPRLRSIAGLEYEEAGRWVSQTTEQDAVLWTSQSQVAFFAERPWAYAPEPGDVDAWYSYAAKEVYLVVDDRHFFEKNAGWAEILTAAERSGGLFRLFTARHNDVEAVVYRVEPRFFATAGVPETDRRPPPDE
jgi:4-amino-4-deoxy-L-arabinose transferase-like glycosyltransferase